MGGSVAFTKAHRPRTRLYLFIFYKKIKTNTRATCEIYFRVLTKVQDFIHNINLSVHNSY